MPQKRSLKRPAKPSYLEWHSGKLRVSVSVPRDLQEVIGATRLKQPLHTDSLDIAEVLKGKYVRQFHQLIDEARKGNRMDPRVRQALELSKARRSASTAEESRALCLVIS